MAERRDRHDTMMNPRIEGLLLATGSSKFRLVTVAARRARQINAYFGQLGEGLGATVPPQVTSLARKPLSIAFEEIDAGKIIGVDIEQPEGAEDGAEPAVPVAVAAVVSDGPSTAEAGGTADSNG